MQSDRSETELRDVIKPSCNVSQRFNFVVGGAAIVAAALLAYLSYSLAQ
jgi:hypothetical protein